MTLRRTRPISSPASRTSYDPPENIGQIVDTSTACQSIPPGSFQSRYRIRKHHVRRTLLLLVLSVWIPAAAFDVTAVTDFTTNEDETLIISYQNLIDHCTITDGPVTDLWVLSNSGNGTIQIGDGSDDGWANPNFAVPNFHAGQYLRFGPNNNINGNDAPIFTFRALKGAANSSVRSVNVDITPVDDAITATSHEFIQPAAPVGADPDLRIREDNLNTWTWQQLRDTLQINDVEGQPWTLRITGTFGGTLQTAGGAVITSATDLTFTTLASVAVKWQPPADVFTKPGPPAEPALPVFKAQAFTTSGPYSISNEVTLSTPVLGVADPVVAPTATTLGAIAPLVVTRGTTTTFTYEQLHALCSGTNDVDRVGTFYLVFNNAGVNGCILSYFNDLGNFVNSQNLSSNVGVNMSEGSRIQLVVPDSLPIGLTGAGSGSLEVAGSAASYNSVPLTLDVRAAPTGGGSNSGAGEAGGGGGCGAGAAGLGIVLLGLGLPLRRRKRSP